MAPEDKGVALPITSEFTLLEKKITIPSRSSNQYALKYVYDGLTRSRSTVDLSLCDLNVTSRPTCILFDAF